MGQVQGTLGKPVEEVDDVLRRIATEQGWAYEATQSSPARLVFTKGLNWFTWGSRLEAAFAASGPGASTITISTSEKFGWSDWGRGRRAATRLLEAAGADIVEEPPV